MDILYMLLSDSWVMKYYKSTKEDVIKIMNGEQVYLSETDLSIFTACILICRVRNLNGYNLEDNQISSPDDLSTRVITKLCMQSPYLEQVDIPILYKYLKSQILQCLYLMNSVMKYLINIQST